MKPLTFGLVGHPVAHSMSPVIHTQAYEHLGIKAEYKLFDVGKAGVDAVFKRLKTGKIHGLNITTPFKRFALDNAKSSDILSSRVGAANVLTLSNENIQACNTDVEGFSLALKEAFPNRKFNRALVVGAGGAAAAVVYALLDAGVQACDIANRTPSGAKALIRRMKALFPESKIQMADRKSSGIDVDLVVYAIPSTAKLEWFDPYDFFERTKAFAFDLGYTYPSSPFLEAAIQSNVKHSDGRAMLIYQALASIRIWTDKTFDIGSLRDKIILQ